MPDGKPHQHIPELFLEIMRHDNLRPTPPPTDPRPGYASWELWRLYLLLLEPWQLRQKELIQAAEKALAWNHNKGNTA